MSRYLVIFTVGEQQKSQMVMTTSEQEARKLVSLSNPEDIQITSVRKIS